MPNVSFLSSVNPGNNWMLAAALLVGLFAAYTARISRAPAEEPHLVGPAKYVSTFSTNPRRLSVLAMFLFAAFVILAVAAGCFAYRLVAGPSLADRVIALNGLVLAGMGGIATHAAHTGSGAFLPALVALALVGPIGTAMIARFIESRGR